MADVAPQAVAWDPLEVSIVVRSGTPAGIALDEVAAVLQDLGATRTWDGYRCFCGDALTLPAALAGHVGQAGHAGHGGRRRG